MPAAVGGAVRPVGLTTGDATRRPLRRAPSPSDGAADSPVRQSKQRTNPFKGLPDRRLARRWPGRKAARSAPTLLSASSDFPSGCRLQPPNHCAPRVRCPGHQPAMQPTCLSRPVGGLSTPAPRPPCPCGSAACGAPPTPLPRTRQRCLSGRSADRHRSMQSRATPFRFLRVSHASNRRPIGPAGWRLQVMRAAPPSTERPRQGVHT